MKRETTMKQWTRHLLAICLMVLACVAAARAQTVIPFVDCVEPSYQIGNVSLTAAAAIGATSISVDGFVPVGAALVINLGGSSSGSDNEERVTVSAVSGSNPYVLTINALTKAHTVSQTVSFELVQFLAFYGYNNTNNGNITLLKGGFNNFFTPGSNSYPPQPSVFLPGIHHRDFSVIFSGTFLDWIVQGARARASNNSSAQLCGGGAITYQGRLNDTNAAANGQYDLQFSLFDAPTAGTSQAATVTIENVQVTNGIFTAQLDFGAAFNTSKSLYLEIGVRPGSGSGNDPFTTLAPRQPLTFAPFAIRAQTALFALTANVNGGNVALNDNLLRLRTSADSNNGLLYSPAVDGIEFRAGSGFRWVIGATERMRLDSSSNLNISGNGIIGGDANISGNSTIGGNANITGTITTGCRAGFTAFAGGRLCVSAMQAAATFYGGGGAIQTCANMQARVGNSADVMLTFSNTGFNYFTGASQGWLADHFADNTWGTWLTPSVTPDFDGTPLNVYNGNGGSPPTLPYRCVY